jgi:glyoxylase-like metal-dependent hydrolase (beta-lactamase superfamily II)
MIHECGDNLFLIDLDQPREGFRYFISSWVLLEKSGAILVDTGPRSTIPVLKQALRKLGITKIKYILLTHIHIDHAGGTGLLMDDYPEAKVICHPKAIPHMVQPEKLWKASQQVLGPIAQLYGRIAPIPEERITFYDTIELETESMKVLKTPGHAPHHLSFLKGSCLFAGEVAGVTCPIEEGFYLRPATPPVFKPEAQRKSLEKVSTLDISTVCFAHYGLRHDPQTLFQYAREQIPLWLDIMEEHLRRKSEPFEESFFNDIIVQDPCMRSYHLLPEDIKVREREFISNDILGMKGYLLKKKGNG